MHSLTQTDQLAFSQLTNSRTLPVASRWAVQVAFLILVWTLRSRTRAHLRRLDNAMLSDIGLSPEDAHNEYLKWFWRP